MRIAFLLLCPTCHENVQKHLLTNSVAFSSVAKGQEFVMESNPALEEWLSAILKNNIEP
jgi:hypothetical protein